MSEKNSLKGFKIITFLIRNKAKVMALVNMMFNYDPALKGIITGALVLGEEVWKYYSKYNK